MKIAVLYIATGRYITFFQELYPSCEENFLKNHEKTYFVFTDNDNFPYSGEKNVEIIKVKKQGWPHDSLLRYDMFLSIEDKLKEFDYCYYINANCKVIKEIGEEIFPTLEQNGLMATVWASQFYNQACDFPYSRNKNSSAYIPLGEGKNYYMGGFNGGIVSDFMKMSREISIMAHKDIESNNLPCCFDESLINKYLLDKEILVLSPIYCYPQGWKQKEFAIHAKMIILKKHHYKYGGHAYLRGQTDKKITPVKWWLNKVFGTNFS